MTVKEAVRTRFLDAAEAEFAATGYGSARTRAIADAAGARIGTLHHYWKSKAELFREVCWRRFAPVVAEANARLECLRSRIDAGEAVPVAELLGAVIDTQFPSTEDGPDKSTELAAFRLLYSRTATDPAPEARSVMNEIFDQPANLFTQQLRRLRPAMDEQRFYWVINCIFGTLIYTQSQGLYAAGRASDQEGLISTAREHLIALLVRVIGD